MKFKKRIIATHKEAIKEAEAVAEEKMNILSKALEQAEKHIEVTYFKEFCEDFISYTTKKIVEKNKGLKELNLSNDKVLNLLDINLNELYELQVQFEENKTKLYYDKNGKPFTRVDKQQYISYTKNEEENRRIEAIENFIKSVEALEEFYHIYKGQIQPLTSNAVRYDLRTNDWIINQIFFR